MSNDLRPIYLTDKITFCTYLFNSCKEKGAVNQADKSKFVKDCADNFPTVGTRDIPGSQYKWDFNGDEALTQNISAHPSRNFMLWDASPITPMSSHHIGMGHDQLKAVANDLSENQCGRFGGDGPSHQVSESTHHAVESRKILFQADDISVWENLGVGIGIAVLGVMAFFSGAEFIPAGANGFYGVSSDPLGRSPLQI